jgi:polyisoprenyl-teichoic acid--peptidoglycan teichoic acid transferase
VLVGLLWHALVFKLALNTWLLGLLRLALMTVAIGWAALFVDAWRIGQPLSLHLGHRRAVVGVNGLLSLSVAGCLLFGAHLVGVQRDLVFAMSGDGTVSGAHDGRFNVLLAGGDSGAGRWGLRPDSMTVASIDAETGRTVLIALPRNMTHFPFRAGSVMDEQFPDGFDADYLNGVSTWAQDNPELFPGSKTPGMDATLMAIEGITGLRINYWAMVNLEGFKDLVDAVGGVELNVRQRIPVGLPHDSFFRYIEPGTRTLDGMDTLWFARAREGSDDYSRMARQKCVMNAMLQQLSPATVVTKFEAIAEASEKLITTDLPASELGTFAELAMKARTKPVRTVSFVPPAISTGNPDITKVHAMVKAAVDRSEGTARKKTTTGHAKGYSKARQSTVGGSIGNLHDGYAANEAADLSSAC